MIIIKLLYILNIRFSPLVQRPCASVYYYELFGGYCVARASWRPCNVKLVKVISSVPLPISLTLTYLVKLRVRKTERDRGVARKIEKREGERE